MRKFLASMAIASALLVSGCGVSTLQEDDPGWDCKTMGNQVCGVQSAELESDAWESFTPDVLPASTVASGFKVTYVASYVKGEKLPDTLTLVPSKTLNYVHGYAVSMEVSK